MRTTFLLALCSIALLAAAACDSGDDDTVSPASIDERVAALSSTEPEDGIAPPTTATNPEAGLLR